jgi:hypothetical protein
MDAMKIYVFSIMHNEEVLLPYFLRHYETFADKIFIVDAYSTDKTKKIAKAHPKVTVLKCPYDMGFTEDDISKCYEELTDKYSEDADWVMCVDGDEFVYHEEVKLALQNAENKGLDVVRTTCYTMVSNKLPTTKGQIYEELNKGIRTDAQDKAVILRGDVVVEFEPGRHSIKNKEDVTIGKANLLLLHYRYLTKDYAKQRSDTLAERMEADPELPKLQAKGLRWYEAAIKRAQRVV